MSAHRCGDCGRCWTHERECTLTPATFAAWEAAHTCCGQLWIDDIGRRRPRTPSARPWWRRAVRALLARLLSWSEHGL